MIQWFRELACLYHAWRYHCYALPRPGEPALWKTCDICGKTVVESWEK